MTTLGVMARFDWHDFDAQPPDVTIKNGYSHRGKVIRPRRVELAVLVRGDAIPDWSVEVEGWVLKKDGSPGGVSASETYHSPGSWRGPEPAPRWLLAVIQLYIDRAGELVAVSS